MKKKCLYIFLILIITFSYLGCKEDPAEIIKEKKPMTDIELRDFYEYLKDNNKEKEPFEIVFIGDGEKSLESKKEYIYFEVVLYYGEDVLEGTYRILYNREGDFTFAYDDKYNVNIRWRKLRPYIADIWEKEFSRDDSDTAPPSVKNVFKKKGVKKAKLVEVGIEKDKKYYAMFKQESYYLPPTRGGKPKRKTNLVLMVSDKPFKDKKPQTELSPLFKEWTY